MAEFMPFFKLPALDVPRKQYFSHCLDSLSLTIDRWEYQPNSFTDEYKFLLDEESFSNTHTPAAGESLSADQLTALNNALSELRQDFNTIYALTDSKLSYLKINDVLPNSITARQDGLLLEPDQHSMYSWASVHPMYWFFIDEYYFFNFDPSEDSFKNILVDYLKTQQGYEKNFATLLDYSRKNEDEELETIINGDLTPSDEFAVKAFSLFATQQISLIIVGGEAIGRIDYDTPYDPNTSLPPPPKRRLNMIFSSKQHRDLNIWEFYAAKQPELHIVSHFFEHRQRVKNDSAMIAGHPMITSIMAHNSLAEQGVTQTTPGFETQVLDLATRLCEGARVDFMDAYHVDNDKARKHSKGNIYLCVDYLEPLLRVQAQLTPEAEAEASQKGINLSPDITKFPYYAGLEFPIYGKSSLRLFNPESTSLHISITTNSSNIKLVLIESILEIDDFTTSSVEVDFFVKSLIQSDGDAVISVRSDDENGPVLKKIAVVIQTPKFIPVRFNEIVRAIDDPQRKDIPTIEQLTLDVIAAINHAFGRQVNFFIYPKTDRSDVQSDLGSYPIAYDISAHQDGDIVRKIQLLEVVLPNLFFREEEFEPNFDPSIELEETKLVKSFIKLKDLSSDINIFWYSKTGILKGHALRDPFLTDQVVIFAQDNELETSTSNFVTPLHEFTHAMGRLLIGDTSDNLAYFKHPPNAQDFFLVLFEEINQGARVTLYKNNPLSGLNEQFIRLDNLQIQLLRDNYRAVR